MVLKGFSSSLKVLKEEINTALYIYIYTHTHIIFVTNYNCKFIWCGTTCHLSFIGKYFDGTPSCYSHAKEVYI